jgi:hypothetical protein
MCLRAGAGVYDLAVGANTLGKGFDAIDRSANLKQQLNSAAIVDPVFQHDSIPKGPSIFAKLARRFVNGRGRSDQGERRSRRDFCHGISYHESPGGNRFLK